MFGVSHSVISRAWNRFQMSGSATQHHAGGRQRASTPREDRFLVLQARHHPFMDATATRNELRNAVGAKMSTQTVRTRNRFDTGVFGLGRHAFAFPRPKFTNRRVWSWHKITSPGLEDGPKTV